MGWCSSCCCCIEADYIFLACITSTHRLDGSSYHRETDTLHTTQHTPSSSHTNGSFPPMPPVETEPISITMAYWNEILLLTTHCLYGSYPYAIYTQLDHSISLREGEVRNELRSSSSSVRYATNGSTMQATGAAATTILFLPPMFQIASTRPLPQHGSLRLHFIHDRIHPHQQLSQSENYFGQSIWSGTAAAAAPTIIEYGTARVVSTTTAMTTASSEGQQ